MKVSELIELLSKEDQSKEVVVYNDDMDGCWGIHQVKAMTPHTGGYEDWNKDTVVIIPDR